MHALYVKTQERWLQTAESLESKSNEKKYPASADATEKGWGPPSIANNNLRESFQNIPNL